jgi:hypothetical protein
MIYIFCALVALLQVNKWGQIFEIKKNGGGLLWTYVKAGREEAIYCSALLLCSCRAARTCLLGSLTRQMGAAPSRPSQLSCFFPRIPAKLMTYRKNGEKSEIWKSSEMPTAQSQILIDKFGALSRPSTFALQALCLLEAELLDEIQTKVLRVFLLAIHSQLNSFALWFSFLQTHATSYSSYISATVLYTIKEKEGKNDRKTYTLPFKSENSQDYAQKPQRNFTFMNSAPGRSFTLLWNF